MAMPDPNDDDEGVKNGEVAANGDPVLGEPTAAAAESATSSIPVESIADAPPRPRAELWLLAQLEAFGQPVRDPSKRPKVVSIEVKRGLVNATLRTARRSIVGVSIEVPALPDSAWTLISSIFSEHTLMVARLLAGELPESFLALLSEKGVALLPGKDDGVVAHCECDVLLERCEHRTAVFELLASELDRDSFLLFLLRGRERAEVLKLLGDDEEHVLGTGEDEAPGELEALPTDPEAFWAAPVTEPLHLGEVKEPEVPAVLVRRLGEFPFWRGTRALVPALERVYRRASKAAIELLRGG